jgi:inosose dehydratase
MSDLLQRIAGGPITWGVHETPGWGHQMRSHQVLSDMADTGLRATELGPDGFLPTDPDELVDYVNGYGLTVVAGFLPAVLYRPEGLDDLFTYADRAARQLARTGSEVAVIGPDSIVAGYDTNVSMSAEEWNHFFSNLTRLVDIIGEHGVTTSIHPHWGMAVCGQPDVERVLESCETGLCLDTGHLYLAGADSLEIARMASGRIDHVHLKDVDDRMAEQVRVGELGFRQAVVDGMFKPLGTGGVDFDGLIRHLEHSGYDGWYVLEQDRALSADSAPGTGPRRDVEISVAHLQTIAAEL